MAAAGPAARKVDLQGKFLMPGMIDAHAHPIAGGVTLIQANFPEIGSLAPGKRADLALVDRDVLTVPAEELKGAKVLFTMFGGKIVYGREP